MPIHPITNSLYLEPTNGKRVSLMSERAHEKKKIMPIILGAICIVLLITTFGMYFLQTNIIDAKDSLYNNYVAEHSYNDTEYNSLLSELASANSNINSLHTEKSELQTWLNGNLTALANANSQINSLQTWLNGNMTALTNANTQIISLQNQLISVNSQIGTLNTQISSLQNQLSTANSQISNLQAQVNNLQTWLNENITAVNALIQTVNQLGPGQMIFTHSDYVTVNHASQILFVGTNANNASKFTVSYIVGSLKSPDIWRVAGSMGKAGEATNTVVVATATTADINVLHTVSFVGFACLIELYGGSGTNDSIYYSITVEAPAGTTASVIYGPTP